MMMFLGSGCASRSRSLILGGAGGVAVGAYTGSAVYSGPKSQIKDRNTLMGAGIGLGVGLLTAYLLHDHVEERIATERYKQDERLRFGDLPPNPFNPSNHRFIQPRAE
jgi:hypothetical protein